MRNTAIKKYKERTCLKRVPSELTLPLDGVDIPSTSGPSDEAHTAEEVGGIINGYLREAPERRRYIFIERLYMEAPVGNIASELGVSVPTVYRELETIKRELAEVLERNGIYI